MKLIRLTIVMFLGFFSCFGFAQNVIQVTGTGQLQVAPDGVEFSVNIREQGPLVSKLFASVNQKTELIISTLNKQEVPDQDIQSMQMQVYPWFEYENQSRVQKGFELTRQIRVNLRNTENLALIFDHIFRIGNVEINEIGLMLSNRNAHYENALMMALENAQAKATKMAANLDLQLGEVVSIIEHTGRGHFAEASTMMRSAAQTDSFLPGELTIQASVDVQIALK